MYAVKAAPSHLCFPVAVLKKPGYFKLFSQEFLISLSTSTGFSTSAPTSVRWPWTWMMTFVHHLPGAVHHGLRQQLERSLFCHRKCLSFCTTAWCWSIPWLLLHWELVVTWFLACRLQVDKLLSCRIHFLCLVCILNPCISSPFYTFNPQVLPHNTLILVLC